jgi:MinD-like ATPase involved in chromosome partitioning or flagellar assembly
VRRSTTWETCLQAQDVPFSLLDELAESNYKKSLKKEEPPVMLQSAKLINLKLDQLDAKLLESLQHGHEQQGSIPCADHAETLDVLAAARHSLRSRSTSSVPEHQA